VSTGPGTAARLDGVEVKLTLAGDRVDQAVQALQLAPDRPRWRIHFGEDVTAAVGPTTPLLDLGVVLRARRRPGEPDDTTIKLRPCRRSQLGGPWPTATKGDGWELKLEADWAGEQRVLAVSLTADQPGDVIADVAEDGAPVRSLFLDEQLDFLRECCDARIDLDALTLLPPVTATRWKEVRTAPAGLEVRAERWTVDHLDFLELSVVADPGDAPAAQRALHGFVGSLGLAVDPHQEPKTRQVLAHLVSAAALPAG
jgi:hypothetical protein